MSDLPLSIDEPLPGPRSYRAVFLDHDGTVDRTEAIATEDDEKARMIAASLVNGHGVDLWERARYLASYPSLVAVQSED